jgi:hypothetical protein
MCRQPRNMKQTSRQVSGGKSYRQCRHLSAILVWLMIWGLRYIQLHHQRQLRWDNHL